MVQRNAVRKAQQERHAIADIVEIVAAARKVKSHAMIAPDRCRHSVARARQVAMYLAHTTLSLRMNVVARAFGRHPSTVSYACRIIEDLRDDGVFDAEMTALEDRISDERLP